MIYYLIVYHDRHESFLEFSTTKPYVDVLDWEFEVQEFKSFSEAKNAALERAIYRRDCLRDEVRELRALREKDVI